MVATFAYDGNAIDYTPAADVPAGEVVAQGELVGVAKHPIATNALGALAVKGVFDFRRRPAPVWRFALRFAAIMKAEPACKFDNAEVSQPGLFTNLLCVVKDTSAGDSRPKLAS